MIRGDLRAGVPVQAYCPDDEMIDIGGIKEVGKYVGDATTEVEPSEQPKSDH